MNFSSRHQENPNKPYLHTNNYNNSQTNDNEEAKKKFKIFIAGIPKTCNFNELRQKLSTIGPVLSLEPQINRYTGLYAKHAFMETTEQGQQRFLDKEALKFKKSLIKFAPYLKGDKLASYLKRFNSKRLFIYRLPNGTTLRDIRSYFSKFGDIKNLYWRNIPPNFEKVAVVIYYQTTVAQKALEAVSHDPMILDYGITVSYQYMNSQFGHYEVGGRGGRRGEAQARRGVREGYRGRDDRFGAKIRGMRILGVDYKRGRRSEVGGSQGREGSPSSGFLKRFTPRFRRLSLGTEVKCHQKKPTDSEYRVHSVIVGNHSFENIALNTPGVGAKHE